MILAQWLAARRGRQVALAAHLDIKAPQVAAWLSGKRPVPLEHCPFIQSFTEGAVTCEELRPDLADYFALIRAQAGSAQNVDLGGQRLEVPLPPAAARERRDPTRTNPFPDLDRRKSQLPAVEEGASRA
jgi:DNA-binding transcriptional regulator YdaS (Cro superfamily)